MKVKELIEKLEKVNPELDVFCTSNTGEYDYCVVNTAGERDLQRWDGEEDEEIPCFVIDEE